MRINHVLIDYESVQPKTFAVLAADHFRIKLFVGSNQNKLNYDIATAIHAIGNQRAEYIKIAGVGPNALDFHIAYYIGLLSAQDPTAYFHIISKDTGFDPLIQHLKDKRVSVLRSESVDDIPLLKISNSKTVEEKVMAIVTNLKQRGASKPRAVKTLAGTISSLFQKQLDDIEIDTLMKELVAKGVIVINGTKVSYVLSE
jgi:hypothetical protein